jgi:hypothetical protein
MDMKNGNWKDTYVDNLKFRIQEDGIWILVNGQHRLKAVIESGKTVYLTAVILESMVESDDKNVDTGAGRTLAQIFKDNGAPYPAIAAAISKLITLQVRGRTDAYSVSQCEKTYASLKDAIDLVTLITPISKGKSIRATRAINAGYRTTLVRALLNMKPERVVAFNEQFISCVCPNKKDQAAIQLRNYYTEQLEKFKGGGESFTHDWALFCENALDAFNHESPLVRISPVAKIGEKLPLPGEIDMPNIPKVLADIRQTKKEVEKNQIKCVDNQGITQIVNPTTQRGRALHVLQHATELLTRDQIQKECNKLPGPLFEGKTIDVTLQSLKLAYPGTIRKIGNKWRYNYAR